MTTTKPIRRRVTAPKPKAAAPEKATKVTKARTTGARPKSATPLVPLLPTPPASSGTESPKLRTVAQADLRAKFNQYCREAAEGTWTTRVKNSSDERFMVICGLAEEPEAVIRLSITDAKLNLARVCALVKSGVSFRVVSARGSEDVILRPYRAYEDPFADLLRDFYVEKVRKDLEERQSQGIEELIRKLQDERKARDEQIETLMKWTRHAVRAGLGYRPPIEDKDDENLKGEDRDGDDPVS